MHLFNNSLFNPKEPPIINVIELFVIEILSISSETSSESPLVGSGLMTNGIMKGLRGKADSDGDKNITAIELFKYIHKDVQLHNKRQHPQLVTSKALYNNVLMSW